MDMAVSWIKMEEDDDENEAAKYASHRKVMEDITEAGECDTNPCSTSSIPKLEKEREVVKTYKLPLCEECGGEFTSSEDFRQHLTRHGSRHTQESPAPPSDDGDRTVTNMHYSQTIKVESTDKVGLVQRQQLPTNQTDGLTVFDGPVDSMYTTDTIVKVESSLPGDLQIQASSRNNYHDCDEERDTNPCSTSSIPKLEKEREVMVKTYKLPLYEEYGGEFTSSEDLRKHLTRHGSRHTQESPTPPSDVATSSIPKLEKEREIMVRTYKLPLCEECGEAFTSSEDFRQHLTRHGSRHTQESPAPPDDALDAGVQGGADAEKSLASEASSHMQSGPGKLRPLAKVLSMCARTDTSVECNSGSHGNVPLTHSEECRICGGRFANLARHMQLHEGRKIWQCKLCSKDFWTKLGLSKHARIVHPEEVQLHFGQSIYKYEMCVKEWELNKHKKLHSQETLAQRNVLKCETKNPVLNGDEDSVSWTSTLNQNEIQRDFYEAGSDQHCNSACVASNAKCLAIARVMNDTPSVDSEKTNTAPSASTGQDVSAEDKERLLFLPLGLRQERLTQAADPQEKNLTSHISSDAYNPDSFSETLGEPHHVSQKRMKYEHQSKFQLKAHKYSFQREKCNVCMNFVLKHNMHDHMRVHTGEKPLQCKVCSRCCSQKSSLKRHMSLQGHMHTCDTTNPNSLSETVRSTSLDLSKKRMKSHEHQNKPKGEGSKHFFVKREQCKVCRKSILKGWMKIHMRVHTGEKPFQCEVCSRCFTQKWSLNQHMRLHTGEKPFQCKVCSRCFSQKSSLKRHMSLLGHMHKCDTSNTNSFSETVMATSLDLSKKRVKSHEHQSKPEGEVSKHSFQTREQCKVCKITISKECMRRHMRVHTGEKPFQCEVCSRCFSQKWSLNQHMRLHTGEKPFQCKVCSRCFSLSDYLKRHMSLHDPKHVYAREQCKVCRKSVLKKCMRVHMRVHTGEKPFQCKVCSRCFRQRGSFNRHMSLHDPEHFYGRKQCKVCGKSVSKDYMRVHMRVHTGEKPFQCKVCPRGFSRSEYLKRHMSVHDPKQAYNTCNKDLFSLTKRATYRDVSQERMKHEHQSKFQLKKRKRPHLRAQCKVCENFILKHNMRDHMRVHTGEKPFQCKVCSMCFTQKGSLKRHMSLHDSKHFYAREQCKVCGKSVLKHRMGIHMRVHTGEKPFQCKVCSRCFSYLWSLKRHMSLHDPKHVYVREQCKVCGKSVSKDYMRVHMRVHNGEKPFQCTVCSRCFAHKSSLKRHMSLLGHMHTCDTCTTNPREKPFYCKVCSRCLTQKSSLKRHMYVFA
ncbi:uncharacterized protein [Diadema antillarum]|uniref:uncharacterized protein n=1 Tax=Diadema antillarum TaxID=105358 RepID=UPI003A8AAB86